MMTPSNFELLLAAAAEVCGVQTLPIGLLEKRSSCKNQLCRFTANLTMFYVYNNEMPHKYGIKITKLCEAKSGYAFNM
jgi:hypothetical protein